MSTAGPEKIEIDPLVGRELQGRYRIVRRIGQGGMGAVYLGQHISIGNPVAVKVLHAKHAEDPATVERFRREAQATTLIRHHNIVGVFDLGQLEDGSLYLVMEHLDGRDWSSDLSKEGPQPIAKVVHILAQVCDALGAAHEAGIVHRDIKPDNIFLVRRSGDPNFVKVLDFGISKIREGASALAPSKTQTGTAVGTPYYMAPEQVQGRKDMDARTDIYAMGVVLFQALTGQYPFDGETYPMLVMSIVTQPIPDLSAYRPDLPKDLQDVLERMVAKDRAMRFGSVEEVKTALTPFARLADHPGSAVLAPRPPLGIPLQSEVRPVSAQGAASPRRSVASLPVAIGILGLVFAGAVTGATIALWPNADAPRAAQETATTVRPLEPSQPSAVGEPAIPAAPVSPLPAGPRGQVAPAPPEPIPSGPASAAPALPDTSAAPASAPEPERPARSERRSPQVRHTPEPRALPQITPAPFPPSARTPRAGANDAIILR